MVDSNIRCAVHLQQACAEDELWLEVYRVCCTCWNNFGICASMWRDIVLAHA